MSIETNKQLVKDLTDAHARHDAGRVREILSPKLVWHMAGQTLGREDYLKGLEEGIRAFSDPSVRIDQTVAEGDRIASLWKVRMRHTGAIQGIAPTNRVVEVSSFWLHRIVDRQIVEAWLVQDDLLSKLREPRPDTRAGNGPTQPTARR